MQRPSFILAQGVGFTQTRSQNVVYSVRRGYQIRCCILFSSDPNTLPSSVPSTDQDTKPDNDNLGFYLLTTNPCLGLYLLGQSHLWEIVMNKDDGKFSLVLVEKSLLCTHDLSLYTAEGQGQIDTPYSPHFHPVFRLMPVYLACPPPPPRKFFFLLPKNGFENWKCITFIFGIKN